MGTVKCDACGVEFAIAPRAGRRDGIETTYFRCPGCEKEYIVYRTNAEVRKLQQQVEQARKRVAKQSLDEALKGEYRAAYQALRDELKAKLDEYNGKTTGGIADVDRSNQH